MPGDPCPYLETVRRHALAAPERTAFELDQAEAEPLRLSYAGLLERVQRLGETLRASGHGDGSRVAICMENRPAWPVAYLGVWYAGGVTVPIDPQLDANTLGRLLDHAEASVCVTSAALRDRVEDACRGAPGTPPAILDLDADGLGPWWDGGQARSAAPPAGAAWEPRGAAEGLGTIMYTSGTTGAPKGVMIRRAAVVANIRAALERIRFSPDDRVLSVLPLFHALPMVANCLGPLYLGASVVFLKELTAERILGAFRRHRITVFVCVPAFFYRIHEQLHRRLQERGPLARGAARAALALSRLGRRALGINLGRRLLRAAHEPFGPTLRLFITGGAKMSAEVYEEFLDWGFVLAQGYGLTEATAILTATPLNELRGDSVGRPLDGVDLRIHEPDDEGIGEVWARGPSIMEGYYRNPEATSAALVDGWLRTGDLGRLLPDGHLQLTGRAKDVIVLASGKNVYPEELEEHYGRGELIKELCILGIEDAGRRGAERLHAVVVPDLEVARRRGYVNVREMVKFELENLGAHLPGHQRITSLEIRNQPLPRTTTRKVKRHELRRQIEARRHGRVAGPAAAAARPASEPAWAGDVKAIIARHAGVAAVGGDEHLDLDLGLESLDRVELFAELEERFGVALPEEAVGELHTVAEVLDLLQGRMGEVEAAPGGHGWSRVLSECPVEVEPYLRRRPVAEPVLWLLGRGLRSLYRMLIGYRAQGQELLPRRYPYLLCANHFSYLDPIFLLMALPLPAFRRVFFVGYSEYFEGRLGRLLARWLRNIPIDPNRNLERAMQAAAEGLRRGMVLVIFPEGGRSIDGSVKEFRRGAAILARHLGAPLVPVGIWGTYEAWPRGGRLRPHPVAVVAGRPLTPETGAAGPEADAELTQGLRRAVVELVATARRLCGHPGAV